MAYRFILEPYKSLKSRFRCPSCNKSNQFSRYIDTEANEYVNEKVGRCNREINCGYHYTPKEYFQDHSLAIESVNIGKQAILIRTDRPVGYIDKSVFTESLGKKCQNYFLEYLSKILIQR